MDIVARLNELGQALALPNKQHDMHELKAAYDHGLSQRVFEMQQHARLPCKLVLVRHSGAEDSPPACVWMPRKMPLYGTRAFEQSEMLIGLRRSFLAEAQFETLVYAIAHELAHVVLKATHSPYRDCEKSTDLCSMMLGYDHMILRGCQYIMHVPVHIRKSWWKWPFFSTTAIRNVPLAAGRYGYLARHEMELAVRTIGYMRM